MSHAKCDRQEVIQACEKWLNWRRDAMSVEVNVLKEKEVSRLIFRAKTPEEAESRVRNSGVFSEYGDIQMKYSWHLYEVKNLLTLAKNASDDVFVDAKTAAIIFKEYS